MKVKVLLGTVAVLFAAYVVGSPYLTVYQLRWAAEDRDGEALAEHIEFPSVRQSLKDQMNAMVLKEMTKDEMKDNPFAALGIAFAGTIVDKMVDAYVTPAGITQMMAGKKPGANPTQTQPAPQGDKRPFENASMAYQSLNKFSIVVKGTGPEEVRFILRRRGLSWMVTEIMLPLPTT